MTRILSPLLALALVASYSPPSASQECAGGRWTEQDLGQVQKGLGQGSAAAGQVAVAPDGTAWAQVIQTRKTPVSFDFFLNGVKKGTYEQVLPGTLRFGATGQQWSLVVGTGIMMKAIVSGRESDVYEGIGEAGVVFSPAGGRHAFSAGIDGKQAMVVDWKAQPLFDAVTPPVWSPDGAHVAYVALSGTEQWVVFDGQTVGKHTEVWEMPAFSPDGAHWAYVAATSGKAEVYLDGKSVASGEPAAGACPVLGKSSFGCLLKETNGMTLVFGAYDAPMTQQNWADLGEVQPASLVVSPCGKRWAFVAKEAGKWKLVWDKGRSDGFERLLWSAFFSADGSHVAGAYEVGEGAAWAWLDGKAMGPYATVSELKFGPDNNLWFVAMKGDKVGLTDHSGKTAEWVEGLSVPVFGAGKAMAWMQLKGGKYVVVSEGVAQPQELEAAADSTLTYSPDSRVVAVIGKLAGRAVAWANGCVSGALDGVALMGDSPLKFQDASTPIIFGRRGDRMLKLMFETK